MALATPEKIQQFNELGFVAFAEPLCPPSELAALRKRYDEVFAADNDEGRREKGLHFDLGGPSTLDGPPEDIATWTLPQVLTAGTALDELAPTLLANAGAISEALLASEPGWGEPSQLKGAHAIMKPPLVGAATPWHQDDAYASPDEEHRRLSCWVPLQDAGVEDGCMQFVPRSHLWPDLPHHQINRDVRIHGLEIELDDALVSGPSGIVSAVACPLPAGGATFHLSRTMHYSQENTQKVPRRAFILGAACPSRPLPAGHEKPSKPWQAAERSAYSIGTGGYQRGSTENKDVFGTPKL
mgnify:CR=1 FL=1